MLLALNLIGWDTPFQPNLVQAQGIATFDCAAVTEIPQQECEALVAFYISTDGDNWINHSGWLQTNTPCTWFGLTCSEGHVTRLELNNNFIHGPLPAEIENLSYLQVLILYVNWITGSISPEIGNLLHLRELSLDGNALGGPIPVTLGNLTNLQGLYLTRNQLSGPIPRELGNLVNVGRLLLYDNQLNGPIPAELGNMIGLWILALQNNQLSGSIPPTLGQLTNLCDLDLSLNQLSGSIPPEFGNLTRIGWCRDMAALHDATNLLWPGLQHLPAGRPPQPNIGYLNLAANHLSGAVPVELGQLADASGVNIGCNMLSGDLPYAVSRVIRWGSLDFNALTGYDPVVYPHWYWYLTQTVAPTNLTVTGSSNGAPIVLNWTPIAYTEHDGYYEISYATAPGGPFTVYGQTTDKTVSSATVSLPAHSDALLFPFAYGHRTTRRWRQLRRLLCLSAEHGDQRVHGGGSLGRVGSAADRDADTHPDRDIDADGDGDRNGHRHTPHLRTPPRRPRHRERHGDSHRTKTATPTDTPTATATADRDSRPGCGCR